MLPEANCKIAVDCISNHRNRLQRSATSPNKQDMSGPAVMYLPLGKQMTLLFLCKSERVMTWCWFQFCFQPQPDCKVIDSRVSFTLRSLQTQELQPEDCLRMKFTRAAMLCWYKLRIDQN